MSSLGEFERIKRWQLQFPELPNGYVGVGDDCSVSPLDDEKVELVTTDMLVEDVHFLSSMDPKKLGLKSLAVNLSDIAAMGGTPRAAYLSLAIPASVEVNWLDRFIEGFSASAREHKVLVLGGDTTRSTSKLVVNVTLSGWAPKDRYLLRSGIRPGDLICVSDVLGDAAAGLKCLQNKVPRDSKVDHCVRAFEEPHAKLEEGRWLANAGGVRAMMDVSDGIASDLQRLCEASKVGFDIELTKVPMSPQCKILVNREAWNSYALSLCGGEDYALLFAIDPERAPELSKAFYEHFNRHFSILGKATADAGRIRYFREGDLYEKSFKGYDHFAV